MRAKKNGYDSVRLRRFLGSLAWRRSYEQKITTLNCRVCGTHIIRGLLQLLNNQAKLGIGDKNQCKQQNSTVYKGKLTTPTLVFE